ncbi:addiction module protein [Marinomonas sp. UCMA 3892]|uniref:addiction module protein n=1 Tax=unclassified Marinomonas TaxID=196814 RepID=UPI00146D9896|nr:addiction module protein [Marinomonas sp. UCMA 3892]NLU97153.1 addiction module protein [Marinomonas sp. UCMA 3892]
MKLNDLTASEKVTLAQQLWDSVASDQDAIKLTTTQKNELDNRLAQFELDQNVGSDWDTIKSKILGS